MIYEKLWLEPAWLGLITTIYKCAVLNVHVHYVMCIPKVFMNCTICTHTFITRTYILKVI